jgi:hypothetical protein
MRFRKSINLGGGARLNLSKSGIGASVGGKGFRVTKKAGGGTRTTASIPGTGISYVKDSKKSGEAAAKGAVSAVPASPNFLFFWIVFRILSVPLIAMGALIALAEPVIGLAAAAFGAVLWTVATGYKRKHKDYKMNKQ